MRKAIAWVGVCLSSALWSSLIPALPVGASFVTFESGHVRPLALAPDGTQLFAVNTPDNRLEIFDIGPTGTLTHAGAVPVGLEPVAVAVRNDGAQAWVVNHLSDSVSVIDLTVDPPRVARTLLVGDEPRDIVFAGVEFDRAFITAAHRGQNTSYQAAIENLLRAPNQSRADIWVFDSNDLGTSLGGDPLTVLANVGDTTRALAVGQAGTRVYMAVFHSGNQTTAVSEGVVCNDSNVNGIVGGACTISGATYPGALPLPETDADGVLRPETGLIVKFHQPSNQWRDQLGRNWNNAVKFNLPDRDVFSIDAEQDPPGWVNGLLSWHSHVGTVLFNMVANPVNGDIYVSNTEARNEVRFEGEGMFGGSTVRGHLHEARITVLSGASVLPRHLNKHIDYNDVPTSDPNTKGDSLATPTAMAITGDGDTLYVAAFGSSTIGVYDTAQLALDTFVPANVPHITVSGGGPSGLALNAANTRLYAFTRFDNSISVIDTVANSEIAHVPLYNPEPPHVVDGRPFLYDAVLTSSNGEASCSSCHVFGDLDSLGWDLGDPDGAVLPNLNPFRVTDPLGISFDDHHPMKGPMTTQSLRGMANHGPMHWRGDRSGANAGGNALDEDAAFKAFNVAFGGLLGRSGPLTDAEMQAFTDFILEVTYPPNPIRALDDSLTEDQQAGRDFYFNSNPSDVFQTCNGCHVLDRSQGLFGSDGFSSFENEPQQLKIPHLRNLYQKIGMFGMPAVPFFNSGDNGHKGDQIRGFGFLHDGSVDTIFRFHQAVVFNQCVPPFGCINPGGFSDDTQRRQVESFMFVFDSNLAPIVGQQTTLATTSDTGIGDRIDLLIAQASSDYFPGTKHCDLVVKGVRPAVPEDEARSWLYIPASNAFRSDRTAEPLLSDAALRALVTEAGRELTYTCVPPGSGARIGLDRDEDGYFDRDELDAGSDPADPSSIPGAAACSPTPLPGCRTPGKSLLLIKDDPADPRLRWKWLKGAETTIPDLGDPVTSTTSYRLCVYSGAANTLVAKVEVPAQGTCGGHPCWTTTGTGLKYKDSTLTNDGAQLLVLKSGAAGAAKTIVKARGANLSVLGFSPGGLTLPVTVQLENSDSECWSSQYSMPIRNDDEQFKSKL